MPIVPHSSRGILDFARVAPPIVWRIVRGNPSALSETAARLFANSSPSPNVLGQEFIPRDAPFIAIFNHYESGTAAAWWGPLLSSRTIAARRTREPREMHWVMAQEWWYPSGIGRRVKQPFTEWLFARLARVYGLVLVPPILQGHTTRGEGVGGVRHALTLTRGDSPPLLGLAPEGRTGPNAALCEPPRATGTFLLLLTRNKLPLLPIGWYEDHAGVITVRFGAPFMLTAPREHDRDARDRIASRQAMVAIGKLLPEKLWGAYAHEIRAALERERTT